MKSKLLALCLLALTTTAAFATDKDSSTPAVGTGLDGRVEALEDTVATLNQAISNLSLRLSVVENGGAQPGSSWTCACSCGGFRYNEIIARSVSARGATADEAFQAIDAQCSDHLFTGVQNNGGYRELIFANVQTACVRN